MKKFKIIEIPEGCTDYDDRIIRDCYIFKVYSNDVNCTQPLATFEFLQELFDIINIESLINNPDIYVTTTRFALIEYENIVSLFIDKLNQEI